jgi:hypothetical protein
MKSKKKIANVLLRNGCHNNRYDQTLKGLNMGSGLSFSDGICIVDATTYCINHNKSESVRAISEFMQQRKIYLSYHYVNCILTLILNNKEVNVSILDHVLNAVGNDLYYEEETERVMINLIYYKKYKYANHFLSKRSVSKTFYCEFRWRIFWGEISSCVKSFFAKKRRINK